MEQQNLFPANDNKPGNFWDGLDVMKLPRTGEAARDLGVQFFYPNEPCIHGHLAPKYSKGGRCVVCTKEASARRDGRTYGGSWGAARANLTRAIASLSGARTYTPSKPCKHGHWLRFVSSNNCVECDVITRKSRREKAKNERLVRLYGISVEQREAMLQSQQHQCAICSSALERNTLMHVDHDHDTGKVRGILCSRCNQAIGLLREDVSILRSAISYIELHKQEAA